MSLLLETEEVLQFWGKQFSTCHARGWSLEVAFKPLNRSNRLADAVHGRGNDRESRGNRSSTFHREHARVACPMVVHRNAFLYLAVVHDGRLSPSGVAQSNRRSRPICQAIRNCFVLIDMRGTGQRPRAGQFHQSNRGDERFARRLFRSGFHVNADLVKSTGNFRTLDSRVYVYVRLET